MTWLKDITAVFSPFIAASPAEPGEPTSQFYQFPEGSFPTEGLHIDEKGLTLDYSECTYTETCEGDLKIAGADAEFNKKITVGEMNMRLCQMFAGRKHYVGVERLDDKYYYVLHYKRPGKNGNGTGLVKKPVILAEFDTENLPIDKKDYLAFKIGKKEVSIREKGDFWAVNLEDTNSPFASKDRFFAIPVNSHGTRDNGHDLVAGDLAALWPASTGKSQNYYQAFEVTDGPLGATDVYVVDVQPKGEMTGKKIAEKDDRPPPPPTFGDEVVQKAGPVKGEDVEIIFVVDTTGSMEAAVRLIVESLGEIVTELRERGAKSVKIGLVTLKDERKIEILMPLSEMNEASIERLFDRLGGIEVQGSYPEAVGIATMRAIRMLEGDKGASRHIWTLTDQEGLGDDSRSYSVKFADAEKTGSKLGIGVHLKDIGAEANDAHNLFKGGRTSFWRTDMALLNTGAISSNTTVKKLRLLGKFEELKNLALQPHTDGDLRLQAVRELIDIEGPKKKWLNVLHQLSEDANSEFTRLAASAELIALGSKVVNRNLRFLSVNSKSSVVEAASVALLLRMGDPWGIDAARRILKDAEWTSSYLIAANALAQAGYKEGRDALARFVLEREQTSHVYDPDDTEETDAIDALVSLGPESKDVLIKIIRGLGERHEVSYYVRYHAILGLMKLDGERGIEFLKEAAGDLNYGDFSIKASLKLEELEPGSGMEYLKKLSLEGPTESIQRTAAIELAGLKETSREALRAILNDSEDESVRWTAVSALAKVGEDVRKELEDIALYGKVSANRLDAIKLLYDLGEKKWLLVLQDLASSPDNAIADRRGAVQTLIDIGPDAEATLQAVLVNFNAVDGREIYFEIVQALARMGNENAATLLKEIALNKWYLPHTCADAAELLFDLGLPAEAATAEVAADFNKNEQRWDSYDDWVGFDGAMTLLDMGRGETGLAIMDDLAKSSDNSFVRFHSAEILINSGSDILKKDGSKALRDLILGSASDTVTMDSIKLLLALGTEGKALLTNEVLPLADSKTAFEIAKAVIASDEELGVAIFRHIVMEPRPDWFQILAAGELASRGKKEGIFYLKSLAQEDVIYSGFRFSAALMLERFGEDTTPVFNELFNESLERAKRSNIVGLMLGKGDYLPWVEFALFSADGHGQLTALPEAKEYAELLKGKSENVGSFVYIMSCLKLKSPQEVKEAIEKLEGVTKELSDQKYILSALARFTPAAGDLDALIKDYLPIVKEVESYDSRVAMIELVADYAVDGHTLSEVTAYKEMLLKRIEDNEPIEMLIYYGSGGVDYNKYRSLPQLAVNKGTLKYFVEEDREAGLKALKDLSLTAVTNESWVYIEYEKAGKQHKQWFTTEIIDPMGGGVHVPKVVGELQKTNDVNITNISYYQISAGGETEFGKIAVDFPCSANSFDGGRRSMAAGQSDFHLVTPFGEYQFGPTTSLDQVEYMPHYPAMGEVQRAFGEYSRIRRDYDEYLAGVNNKADSARAKEFWEKLKESHGLFMSALSRAKGEGVPEVLTLFYGTKAEEEGHIISALSRMFSENEIK